MRKLVSLFVMVCLSIIPTMAMAGNDCQLMTVYSYNRNFDFANVRCSKGIIVDKQSQMVTFAEYNYLTPIDCMISFQNPEIHYWFHKKTCVHPIAPGAVTVRDMRTKRRAAGVIQKYPAKTDEGALVIIQ